MPQGEDTLLPWLRMCLRLGRVTLQLCFYFSSLVTSLLQRKKVQLFLLVISLTLSARTDMSFIWRVLQRMIIIITVKLAS